MNYLRYLMIGFLLFSNGVTAETEEGIAIEEMAKRFYEIMRSHLARGLARGQTLHLTLSNF